MSLWIVCLTVLLGGSAFAQSLSGTVYGGGSPIAAASVDALFDGTTTVATGSTTDAAGHYTLTLAAGTYDLRVTPPVASGYGQEIIQNVDVNGSVNQDVILLSQAGGVSGTITGYGGAPLAGVSVGIYTTSWQHIATVTTDVNGLYAAALSGGGINIQLSGSDALNALAPSSWNCTHYGTVVVGATVLDFPLGVVQSSGVVQDTANNLVPNASIQNQYTANTYGATTQTYCNGSTNAASDASGAYAIRGFAGTQNWTVYPTSAASSVFSQSRTVTVDELFDVTLPDAVALSGFVTGYLGSPLPNTIVYVYTTNWQYLGQVTTDANGFYSYDIGDGTYNLQVNGGDPSGADAPSSFSCQQYNVTVAGATAHDVNLPVAQVSGLVTTGAGILPSTAIQATSYAYDYTLPTYCNASSSATSDGSGAYTIAVLSSAGTASMPTIGYHTADFTITPPGGSGYYPLGLTTSIPGDTTLDLLVPDPIVASGTVRGYLGQGIPNTNVYFYTTNWQYLAQTTADASGFYSLNMSPGTFNLQYSGNDYTNLYGPQSWNCSDYNFTASVTATYDFVLPVVAVDGYVTDSNYAPVPGVAVQVQSVSYDYTRPRYCNSSYGGSSDASGSYTSRQFANPNSGSQHFDADFTFSPPSASGFAAASVQDVQLNGDLNQAVVLQHPDLVPPVIISGPTVIHISDDTVSINWSTDEPATSIVDFGLGVISQQASQPGFVTVHSVTLMGLVPSSIYAYNVSSSDASGNGPTTSGVIYFTTQDPPGDITPPVLTSGPTVTFVDQTSAIVTWTTDEPTDEVLYWGVNPSLANVHQGAPGLFVQTHTVTLSGLTASTSYTIQVAASDPDGNGPTNSGIVAFSTTALPDTQAPVILSGPTATAVTDTSITVTWTTDEPSDSGVSYNDGAVFGLINDPTFVTTHTQTISGLLASTTYFITVSSTDPVGNGPTLGAVLTVTTSATPDTTAPTLSGITVSNVTDTTATISWTTDEAATGSVGYGLSGGAFTGTVGDLTLQVTHTLLITGLSPLTAYDFAASSTDSSGNIGSSPTFTFTTLTAACTDGDADGICDSTDVCPTVADPAQQDADGDGVGDLCDDCPSVADPLQTDVDGDGFADACDNCAAAWNPSQNDSDGDTFGDACDQACASIQRAAFSSGVCFDAQIAFDPTDPTRANSNFGALTTVSTGTVGTTYRQIVLQFDLALVPASATVQSSTLRLRKATAILGGTISLYPILTPWTESTVSWNALGGAFGGAIASFLPASIPTGSFTAVDLTSITQGWLDGSTSNHGVMLDHPGGGRATFGAGEAGMLVQHPELFVCYVVPG